MHQWRLTANRSTNGGFWEVASQPNFSSKDRLQLAGAPDGAVAGRLDDAQLDDALFQMPQRPACMAFDRLGTSQLGAAKPTRLLDRNESPHDIL